MKRHDYMYLKYDFYKIISDGMNDAMTNIEKVWKAAERFREFNSEIRSNLLENNWEYWKIIDKEVTAKDVEMAYDNLAISHNEKFSMLDILNKFNESRKTVEKNLAKAIRNINSFFA